MSSSPPLPTYRATRVGLLALAAPHHLHLPLKLFLQRCQVERRAFLHRRVLEEGLGGLADLLLHEDEAPELIGEPVVVGQRSAPGARQPRALEGIEPKV